MQRAFQKRGMLLPDYFSVGWNSCRIHFCCICDHTPISSSSTSACVNCEVGAPGLVRKRNISVFDHVVLRKKVIRSRMSWVEYKRKKEGADALIELADLPEEQSAADAPEEVEVPEGEAPEDDAGTGNVDPRVLQTCSF